MPIALPRPAALACALVAALAWPTGAASARDGVIVIGHPGLAAIDEATLIKVYTGRVIEVGGVSVTAINASGGTAVRMRFLQDYLHQDEEKYTAYWVVRRYIGKGAPPRELGSNSAVIDFVQSTPGAIGYIEEADLRPGMNVLLK